jgi:hypothetical protein
MEGAAFADAFSALVKNGVHEFVPPDDDGPPLEEREDPTGQGGRQKQQPSGDSAKIKFSLRQPLDILKMVFDPGDVIIESGYLEKGAPFAVCGRGGIGKSRLIMQLAICCALGLVFLNKWKTNAKGLKWLFLQDENGNRRLQNDLAAMMREFSPEEQQTINDAIFIHTLENDDDGYMRLSNAKVVAGIDDLIIQCTPDIVVWDPLRDINIGDINSDADMGETLSEIARITRKGNIKRIPIIIHHALAGKTGTAKAVGWERGDFGRNSKVLMGFVRAQWNLAPAEADLNDKLIFASGKCNNAEEFEPFGIALEPITMTYACDDSIDIEGWRDEMGISKKATAKSSLQRVVDVVKKTAEQGIMKDDIVRIFENEGDKKSAVYKWIKIAIERKEIIVREHDSRCVLPEFADIEIIDPRAHQILWFLKNNAAPMKPKEWRLACNEKLLLPLNPKDFSTLVKQLERHRLIQQTEEKTWSVINVSDGEND